MRRTGTLALLALLPGCAAELVAPTVPDRVQPKLAAPSAPLPADGKTGRIVIDSDSLPYEVREVVDLPLGTHRLAVGATRVSVTVSPKPTVVRVTQPEEDRLPTARYLGLFAMPLGATGVGVGGAALALDAASHKSEHRNLGIAAISVGGVLLVTGIVASYLARGSTRPGGTRQFTPQGPAFVVK